MSGSVRTHPSRLRLAADGPGDEQRCTLLLSRSIRLERFAAASATAGLDLPEAIRLALQHALALQDAAAFGLDADAARRRLNRAAAGARASRPLGDGEASHLRRLTQRSSRPVVELPARLEVKLDERTSTRVGDSLDESAIRPAVVAEMIRWQVAALLEGRTLGEWALHSLAQDRLAA
jgi:hypothetical protein